MAVFMSDSSLRTVIALLLGGGLVLIRKLLIVSLTKAKPRH